MPDYQEPTLDELYEAIEKHIPSYKKTDNPKRLALVKLLNSLKTNVKYGTSAQAIVLGVCIYACESIDNEYQWFGSAKNSEVFQIVEKILNINDQNKIDDKSKFIYLINLFNYIKFNKHEFPDNLDKAVLEIIIKVKSRLDTPIQRLSERLPTITGLKTAFKKILPLYKKKYENPSLVSSTLSSMGITGQSNSRKDSEKLLEGIEKKLGSALTESKEEENSQHYTLLFGTLIHIMWKIESEHTFSPINSKLYELCQKATNVKSTRDLDLRLRNQGISNLLNNICTDVNSLEKIKFWKDNGMSEKQLNYLQKDLINQMSQINETQNKNIVANPTINNYLTGFFDALSTNIAQLGVSYVALELTNFMAINQLSLEALLLAATPQNAIILFGLIYTLRKLSDALLTRPATSFIKPFIEAPLTALRGTSFFNRDIATEVSPLDRLFVEALYRSPDTVCSKEEKEKLERLFDLKPVDLTNTEKLCLRS